MTLRHFGGFATRVSMLAKKKAARALRRTAFFAAAGPLSAGLPRLCFRKKSVSQHPLQIFLIMRSSFRFSAATAASVLRSTLVSGPVTDEPPAARVAGAALPDEAGAGVPTEFAVPAEFVPGV
jgi:hypothetical protein